MQELNLKTDGKDHYEVFGLTEERGQELCYEMEVITHELKAPPKPGSEKIINEIDLFIRFIKLAKNEEERAYLGLMAGRQAMHLHIRGRFV